MITFTQGDLFESDAEALVNTVNTVGVMGKGIALMFKERFAENFRLYAAACKANEVVTGAVFVTEVGELTNPRRIINFPTKRHWRAPSRIEWIQEGLHDLRRVLDKHGIRSVAIPPLGAGNGGLEWGEVRRCIEDALGGLDVDVVVFEPTDRYLSSPKSDGVERLTPAYALIATLVRRYQMLDMECSLLEIQKLAWLLERAIGEYAPSEKPLGLQFSAGEYGPYSDPLRHVLNALDGSFLRCAKRIADAGTIRADTVRSAEGSFAGRLCGGGGERLPTRASARRLADRGIRVAVRHGAVGNDGLVDIPRRRRAGDGIDQGRAEALEGSARLRGEKVPSVRRQDDRHRSRASREPTEGDRFSVMTRYGKAART